jgi:hypothetical protein
MSLSEHLKGTVQLSPRGGRSGPSHICRMSVYDGGKGKNKTLYAAIRLNDAAIKETGFKVNAPLYLHAQPSFLVITSEGSGRPFSFTKESNGKLRISVLLSILSPIVDLTHLSRPQEMKVLAVEKGLVKLQYPAKTNAAK